MKKMKEVTIVFDVIAPDLEHAEAVARSYGNYFKNVPDWVKRLDHISVKFNDDVDIKKQLYKFKVSIGVSSTFGIHLA